MCLTASSLNRYLQMQNMNFIMKSQNHFYMIFFFNFSSYKHIHIHILTYIYMYIYIIYIYVLDIYIYIYLHTYIHTYIHTFVIYYCVMTKTSEISCLFSLNLLKSQGFLRKIKKQFLAFKLNILVITLNC